MSDELTWTIGQSCGDDEIDAMRQLLVVLRRLTETERNRVLQWACDRNADEGSVL